MMIKQLKEKDLPLWLHLRHQLWPNHTLEALNDECVKIYNHLHEMPVFIALHQKDIVGFIEVSIKNHAPGCHTTNIGYIEGWYVIPKMRKQGIGRKLILKAEAWARRKGCQEMASDTTHDYPLSPVVHKALGYIETDTLMHYKKTL